MTCFYDAQRKCEHWLHVMKWLLQDWKVVSGVRSVYSNTILWPHENVGAIQTLNGVLVCEVATKYDMAFLKSRYALKMDSPSIPFDEVVGYVTADNWVNDSVISFVLNRFETVSQGGFSLSSYVVDVGFPSSPTTKFSDFKCIALPVNIHGYHWAVIMVAMATYIRTRSRHTFMIPWDQDHIKITWKPYGGTNSCHFCGSGTKTQKGL